MNHTAYAEQLDRYNGLLSDLKSPEQTRKSNRHPDIHRARLGVEQSVQAARALVGNGDEVRYEESLVSVRRAVGSWRSADSGHGPVA